MRPTTALRADEGGTDGALACFWTNREKHTRAVSHKHTRSASEVVSDDAVPVADGGEVFSTQQNPPARFTRVEDLGRSTERNAAHRRPGSARQPKDTLRGPSPAALARLLAALRAQLLDMREQFAPGGDGTCPKSHPPSSLPREMRPSSSSRTRSGGQVGKFRHLRMEWKMDHRGARKRP
ncbi:hypothetical protein CTRI78_v011318 [Colletotrichum trifolii]|uniref:Uncharacterized protein n=1 Tax=Colletotrichum trifolii TaxID=5466 RepID=A0A4R8QJM7_COLTR|nr:hypothetical protein CTRI78_v011318 [Colletotrichum trifolii]